MDTNGCGLSSVYLRSGHQGSRLLTYVDVIEEIALLEADQQEADHVDRSFELAELRDLALNASTESNRVRRLDSGV